MCTSHNWWSCWKASMVHKHFCHSQFRFGGHALCIEWIEFKHYFRIHSDMSILRGLIKYNVQKFNQKQCLNQSEWIKQMSTTQKAATAVPEKNCVRIIIYCILPGHSFYDTVTEHMFVASWHSGFTSAIIYGRNMFHFLFSHAHECIACSQ